MRQGFTLAESLITLGIIGVVAALTIPTLVSKHKEKVFITTLKQTYSIFSQAFIMAEKDIGPVETWDIGKGENADSSSKLYNILKPYLINLKDCNVKSGCFASSYKNLQGGNFPYQPNYYSRYSKGILSNGVSFLFWSGGSGCNINRSVTRNGIYSHWCGSIYVDINGYKKPNQAGIDYHKFAITTKGIFPVGLPDHATRTMYCNFRGNSSANGEACTGWAIYHQNMDYLRRDISDEL